jgi:hypothetical protein
LTARLYALHDEACRIGSSADGAYEALSDWPGDEAFFNVLVWAQANASFLSAEAAQEAGVLRVQLAQVLRDRLDALQLRAIEDSRSAATPWERLAPALAVASATGAYNRWRRLEVAVRGTDEDRRSPEAARALEARLSAEAAARLRQVEAEDRRFPAVQAAARSLLAEYKRGQVLADPDDDFWWDQLASVIDDRTTPTERASLALYLRKVTEEVIRMSHTSGQPAGTSSSALRAVGVAAQLVLPDQPPPTFEDLSGSREAAT